MEFFSESLFVIVVLFSFNLVSGDLKTVSDDDEKMFKIEITVEHSSLSGPSDGAQKTGFSPARTVKRQVGLDSPLKIILKPTVRLTMRTRKHARRLFADEGNETVSPSGTAPLKATHFDHLVHVPPSSETSSGEHAANARTVQAYDSPEKQVCAPEEFVVTQFDIFDSQTTAFASGKKAFLDPCCPETSILLDCDHAEWGSVMSNLIASIDVQSQESFVTSVVSTLYKHADELKKFIYFNSSDSMLECRHYATIALAVFSKLLSNECIPFSGAIHFIGVNGFNQEWRFAGDGHAWNFLRLSGDSGEMLWFVDVLNRRVVNLSKTRFLTHHEILDMRSGEIKRTFLKATNWFYPYVRATREKFGLPTTRRKVIYDSPEALRAAAKKVLANMKKPATHIEFEVRS